MRLSTLDGSESAGWDACPLHSWISRADAVGRCAICPCEEMALRMDSNWSYGANFFCWLPMEMDTCWLSWLTPTLLTGQSDFALLASSGPKR